MLGPVAVFSAYPLDHDTTSGSKEFLPAGDVSAFEGEAPVRVDLFADKVDAWNRVIRVKVGSAWVRPEIHAVGGAVKALGQAIRL